MKKTENIKIYRALDANFNRAAEGLRVIEDYFRFIRIDAELQKKLKASRHKLSAIVANYFDYKLLLDSRNSTDDNGAGYSTESENSRNSPEILITANFKRVQQSMRALEEYSKMLNAEAAEKFKGLRFEIYELEKFAGL